MKNLFLSVAIAFVAVACQTEKKAAVGSASQPANAECSKACSTNGKECSDKAACDASKKECDSNAVCPVTGKPKS